MDKKQIAKLVEMSFVDEKLDSKSVNKIIQQLNGAELREYLKILQEQEKNLNVYVDHSFALSTEDKKQFAQLFSNRNIVFRQDPDLVFGLRITDRDKVYNFNMKNALDQIKAHINKA